MQTHTLLTALTAAALPLALPASAQDHQHQQHAEGANANLVVTVDENGNEYRAIVLHELADAQTVPAPFVGVGCEPVSPELAAHLPVPQGVGLRVHYVEPDSPAAAAGLADNDVLVKLGDQWLINAEQMAVLIRLQTAGEAATFTVIRHGQETAVQVTPEERESRVLLPGGFASIEADHAQWSTDLAFPEQMRGNAQWSNLLAQPPGHVARGFRFPGQDGGEDEGLFFLGNEADGRVLLQLGDGEAFELDLDDLDADRLELLGEGVADRIGVMLQRIERNTGENELSTHLEAALEQLLGRHAELEDELEGLIDRAEAAAESAAEAAEAAGDAHD